MSSELGPVDVCCDAPPYPVVQACRAIRIRSPEDVRWLRLSTFRNWQESQHGLSLQFWKALWHRGKHAERACTCGEALPQLGLVVFTFNTGDKVSYLLGQCRRCRTVFWDEA